MKDRVTKTWSFLRTTGIGGVIFLLPLAVIGWLLGYVFNVVMLIYEPLKRQWPVSSAAATGLLFLVAVAILVLLCFACGLAARRAIARKFSQLVEKHLVMVFPKYAIYKDILAGNVGGDVYLPSLTPVTIQLDDMIRIGYQAGETDQGLAIVYLPGSPDPWMGSVVLVDAHRVRPLDVDFGETSAICERLGRDSEHLLAAVYMAGSGNPAGGKADAAG